MIHFAISFPAPPARTRRLHASIRRWSSGEATAQNVRLWLQADIRAPPIDVRCTPKSGHSGIHVRFLMDYVRSSPRSGHSCDRIRLPLVTQSGHRTESQNSLDSINGRDKPSKRGPIAKIMPSCGSRCVASASRSRRGHATVPPTSEAIWRKSPKWERAEI